jgi:hypothetical protein
MYYHYLEKLAKKINKLFNIHQQITLIHLKIVSERYHNSPTTKKESENPQTHQLQTSSLSPMIQPTPPPQPKPSTSIHHPHHPNQTKKKQLQTNRLISHPVETNQKGNSGMMRSIKQDREIRRMWGMIKIL